MQSSSALLSSSEPSSAFGTRIVFGTGQAHVNNIALVKHCKYKWLYMHKWQLILTTCIYIHGFALQMWKYLSFLHITCLAFLKTKPIYAVNSCPSSYISTLCVSPILNPGDFVEPGCKVDLMVQWVQPACFYHKLPSPISITNVGHRLCLVYSKLEGFGPR